MSDKFEISDVVLFLEEDYQHCVRSLKAELDRCGVHDKHIRELKLMRSVVNSFHYILNDPEGFRAFAQSVHRKFGGSPKTGVVAEIDALLAEMEKRRSNG